MPNAVRSRSSVCGLVLLTRLTAIRVQAQADEIQVYKGWLAPVGVFNLTIHHNFTPKGIKTLRFRAP